MPRQWSPEQRAKMRELMRERQAKRKLAASGELTEAAPAGEDRVTITKDDAAEELKQLAASLYKVADNKAERGKKLDELEGFLKRLDAKDFPELANSEIVMRFIDMIAERKSEINKDDPPGTIYNRGTIGQYKKAWTEHDLRTSDIAIVEFEVNEPETVVWNGLRRDYEPGITYADYRCFIDQIRERNRNLRLAEEHAEYLFKLRQTLTDNGIATMGTARVRGSADRGSYRRAAGLFEPEYAVTGGDDGETE
jgi:hypothetical protein